MTKDGLQIAAYLIYAVFGIGTLHVSVLVIRIGPSTFLGLVDERAWFFSYLICLLFIGLLAISVSLLSHSRDIILKTAAIATILYVFVSTNIIFNLFEPLIFTYYTHEAFSLFYSLICLTIGIEGSIYYLSTANIAKKYGQMKEGIFIYVPLMSIVLSFILPPGILVLFPTPSSLIAKWIALFTILITIVSLIISARVLQIKRVSYSQLGVFLSIVALAVWFSMLQSYLGPIDR